MPAIMRFNDDGTVEFTRNTALEKLVPDAAKSVVRMTDIEFINSVGGYTIKWLTGPLKDRITDKFHAEYAVGKDREIANRFRQCKYTEAPVLLTLVFETYEDAVAAEVILVEGLRRQGHDLHA